MIVSQADSKLRFSYAFHRGDENTTRTLLLLHGTGGDEFQLLEFGRSLDPHAHLLGIRGRSREEGMNRFFRRYAEGVFDEADLAHEAQLLSCFIAEIRNELALPRFLYAVGFSNGANMAAAELMLYPDALDGAILFRAMCPFQSPPPAHAAGKRILLISGSRDPLGPLDSAETLRDLLRSGGADVEHRVLETGHGLTPADSQIAMVWLQHLTPGV